jgi:hypothetical protein
MASTYLTRTATSGNRQIATFSGWIKKGSNSVDTNRVFLEYSTSTNYFEIRWRSVDNLRIYEELNGGTGFELITNRLFRDNSAWYHIVVEIDTTQATASDRIKLYINGVQETSFSTETYPSQNYNVQMNVNSKVVSIGAYQYAGSNYFNGSMSHLHWIDGTAYDADTFGETDATTGIWKPKTAPSVTYGTKFENSGAFGTDSSGNGNNFTVNGTMTQTIDTPSNVFCVLNALDKKSSFTLTNGNNTIDDTSNTWGSVKSTIGFSSGKYYAEGKIIRKLYGNIGVARTITDGTNQTSVDENKIMYGIYGGGRIDGYIDNVSFSSETSIGEASVNDIIGIAIDCDNGTLTFYKNGTQIGSTITNSNISNYEWTFACQVNSSGFEWNFGNGYFGTTAVSSAENPDDGIGIFEYAVPTGYKALCTKSINSQEYD